MLRRIVLAVLLLSLLTGAPALADTLITMKISQGPLLGRPAEEGESTIWIDGKRSRINQMGNSIIVDATAKTLHLIDHKSKSYNKLDLPIDFRKLVPEEMAPLVEQMLTQMKMEVVVEASDETRKIGEYTARKYMAHVTGSMGMQIELTMWVSKDVPIDLVTYKSFKEEMARLQPTGAEWMKKIHDIDGFAVLTETTMQVMGNEITSREELISVESKTAPEGTYGPPAAYVSKPFNPLAAMQP